MSIVVKGREREGFGFMSLFSAMFGTGSNGTNTEDQALAETIRMQEDAGRIEELERAYNASENAGKTTTMEAKGRGEKINPNEKGSGEKINPTEKGRGEKINPTEKKDKGGNANLEKKSKADGREI
jgi:hypothetical protein